MAMGQTRWSEDLREIIDNERYLYRDTGRGNGVVSPSNLDTPPASAAPNVVSRHHASHSQSHRATSPQPPHTGTLDILKPQKPRHKANRGDFL
ncbi:hypothetical protein E2C01_012886 [Portunus trituberculatus]|uniref:Uncharacterized protein n=1 Tax=Portunus trituberculatus TaxID=210409 RepID=A0A5B7DF76_PORTR|nr:hypothetical protein [Portunus trituberculatus]